MFRRFIWFHMVLQFYQIYFAFSFPMDTENSTIITHLTVENEFNKTSTASNLTSIRNERHIISNPIIGNIFIRNDDGKLFTRIPIKFKPYNEVEQPHETSTRTAALNNDFVDTTEDPIIEYDDKVQSKDEIAKTLIDELQDIKNEQIEEPGFMLVHENLPQLPRKSRQLGDLDTSDSVGVTPVNENDGVIAKTLKDIMEGDEAKEIEPKEKCCKCNTTPIPLQKIIDDCPCRSVVNPRATGPSDDMLGESSSLIQSITNAFSAPRGLALPNPTPILKPEVGLAANLIDTLRSASEVELQNAKERDAVRALDQAKKKAEEAREKADRKFDETLQRAKQPGLKVLIPKKTASSKADSRNAIMDLDFAGSENRPNIVVQPDYLMRPSVITYGPPSGGFYLGQPSFRQQGGKIGKPIFSSKPTLSILGKSAMGSARQAIKTNSLLGSSPIDKKEIADDKSRRLLTAIRDALGLDRRQDLKCKVIIHDD